MLIAFSIALLASLGMTIPVRQLALHLGMLDRPGPRKVHGAPVPLLGGLAIYFGFVLAAMIAVQAPSRAQMVGILAGATMLAIVGFLDDGKLLHHQVKLFIGMPLAALFLIFSGIRAQLFTSFVHGATGIFLDGCLTILWVVGITASFSILDHMDGLCAGVAAIAAAFFTIDAGLNGQILVRTLAAATFGAALGFLRWNFTPAKIFMGDSGAMFLGFLMATLGLKIRPENSRGAIHWLVPLLILGAALFDTTLVSISRSRRGLIPFTSPGKDHAAHRLANLGLGTRGAVLVMYALGVCFGVLGLLVQFATPSQTLTIVGGILLAVLLAVYFLENAPFEHQKRIEERATDPVSGSF
ncbi:MAG: glycosyltransferase family 4 protein [Candidatus Acidiferrales bacterium]